MVNRTIILVALFAWICATTVAQGAHTISSVHYTIILNLLNKFVHRGSLRVFNFSLTPIWLHSQMINVSAWRTVETFAVRWTAVVVQRNGCVVEMILQWREISAGVTWEPVPPHCHQMRSMMAPISWETSAASTFAQDVAAQMKTEH